MLRKYAILLSPVANTEGNSTTPSDETAASSTENTAEQEQSSQAEESAEKTDGEETATEATGEEQTTDQQNEQSQQQQEENAVNVVVDKEEDKALPFHKHARFQEIVTEKNAARSELERVKPLIDQATAQNEILRTHNIAPQEFQSAIQYLIALRTNPQQAYEMLKPTFEQLSTLVGDRLPDDLAAKVAAGTLDPQDAKQLARARGQETYQNVRQNWQQNSQQQQVGDVVGSSINMWEGMKKTADPDFKQGSDLYQLVDKNIRSMPPFRTAQEAMQGCEKAYTEAKAFLGKFQPKVVTKVKPGLQSRQQGNGNQFVIKDSKDAITAIQRGLKPHQVRYS